MSMAHSTDRARTVAQEQLRRNVRTGKSAEKFMCKGEIEIVTVRE